MHDHSIVVKFVSYHCFTVGRFLQVLAVRTGCIEVIVDERVGAGMQRQ